MPVKTESLFLRPFESLFKTHPIAKGSRVKTGVMTCSLESMGYDEPDTDHDEIESFIKWNIAHKHYALLTPCISIYDCYDKHAGVLPYEIDLYGDRRVATSGRLTISSGDYYGYYLPMTAARRKDAIRARIALSNVGLLVPYIHIDDLHIDAEEDAQAAYTIRL